MNRCIFNGRLAADPETRYTQGATPMAITRFRAAVNRRFKREGEPAADFLSFVAFGKTAENIGKYFHKGDPILIESHVQAGSYTNKDGQKVYTTDFIVDSWDFIGGKSEKPAEKSEDGEFMDVPEGEETELPWS